MDSYEELQKQRQALKEELNAAIGDDAERQGAAGNKVFETLAGSEAGSGEGPDIDLVLDIPVRIAMEVGSTQISIRELLALNQGSVVELERLAGEPLDVLVNGTLVARGEVVVISDKLGIRLTDVVSPAERISTLK